MFDDRQKFAPGAQHIGMIALAYIVDEPDIHAGGFYFGSHGFHVWRVDLALPGTEPLLVCRVL